MSGSLGRAAAALLRWGRGAGGGGLRSPGVRAAGSGGGGGGGSAERLDAMVKKDKVVVFLKGTPEQPQCGFSNAVVQILRLHGVSDYAAYNVLDDPQLRQGQGRRARGGGGRPGGSAGRGPVGGSSGVRARGPVALGAWGGDGSDLSGVWGSGLRTVASLGGAERPSGSRSSRGAAVGVSGRVLWGCVPEEWSAA